MKITKAVILAGGLGTRMAPASRYIAKEMLPVVDRPVMDFLVEDLINSGITEILIVSKKEKTCIQNFFTSERVKVTFVFQDLPLGVVDALLLAENFVQNQPFILLYGDVLFSAKPSSVSQMLSVFGKNYCSVVATRKVFDEKISLYGVIGFQEIKNTKFVTSIIEKPTPKQAPSNMVLAGQYILMPEIFSYLKKVGSKGLFTDCLLSLSKESGVAICEIKGNCFDVGSKIGYVMATVHCASKHPQIKKEFKNFFADFNYK